MSSQYLASARAEISFVLKQLTEIPENFHISRIFASYVETTGDLGEQLPLEFCNEKSPDL